MANEKTLSGTASHSRYTRPIPDAWCSWNGLWGGSLLGFAIEALEAAAGRPVRALNAQFLTPAGSAGLLQAKPHIVAAGRTIMQASVDISLQDKRLLSASAILSPAPQGLTTALRPPAARAPHECPPRHWMAPEAGGLRNTLEARIAKVEAGRVLLWTRCVIASDQPLTADLIASLADHPAYAATLATGGAAFGITLDTGLQFFHPADDLPGDSWLLQDIVFVGLADEMAMASAHVWCGKRLLAKCDQTLLLRKPKAGGASPENA